MAQQRRTEKKIGEYTFLVPLLGVRDQRRLLFKLAGVVGIPLAELAGEESKEDQGVSTKLWDSLGAAFKSLADEKVIEVYEYAIQQFAKETKVNYVREDGKEVEPFLRDVYDDFFAGKLDLEFKWIWACLEANYSGFLESVTGGRAKGLVGSALKAVAESQSPKESTGS